MGTYDYNLAKFLTELLDPVIPKEHCAKDSFSFCEEIQKVSTNDNFLVSYMSVVFLQVYLCRKQLKLQLNLFLKIVHI